jgi:hypothetical protein
MSGWPALNPVQQEELLGEMTAVMVAAQPPDWREVLIDYHHLGKHTDGVAGALDPGGTYRLWNPPPVVWQMFQRLRGGMYREGEGTWFSARMKIERPARFTVRYSWRERPSFPTWPTPDQFVLELERFPRGDAYLPPWFRENLPTLPGR